MLREYIKDIDNAYLAIASALVLALSAGFAVQAFTGSAVSGDGYRTTGAAPQSFDRLALDTQASTEERKKVTSYNLDFKVPDVQKAMDSTATSASSYGGYVDSSNFNRDRGVNGYMTVRVPENNVTGFISDLENDYNLQSKSKNIDDVTEQYTELELELKNKRQELRRLEELMNRTEDVDSLIKIQERMSELRSRIQYLESRLEDLDKRVEYTRVHIQFEGPAPITTEFGLRDSVQQAYQGIFSSINLIIVGVGYLLPFAVIIGVVYAARRRLRGN